MKNTLMTVVSIARQTLRRSQTLPEFEGAFLGRFQALASAHALLLRGNWGDMDLQRLDGGGVEAVPKSAVAPTSLFRASACSCRPQLALTMNLIVYELATNVVEVRLAEHGVWAEWTCNGAWSTTAIRSSGCSGKSATGLTVTPPGAQGVRHHADPAQRKF